VIPPLTVSVLFEPAARASVDLSGATAVVIDAIRATTTIVSALAAGCVEVIPYRTPEEVLAEAARRPAGTVVTAGERLGERIEELDLNNSPSVMTPERVGGRSLLLTTTNGTQAILDALRAETVLVAALANRRAVARRAAALKRRIVLFSAGTVGHVSCEDTLVAGAVVEALVEQCGMRNEECGLKAKQQPEGGAVSSFRIPNSAFRNSFSLDDSARVALAAWRGAKDDLARTFHETWGGAFIARLGLEADLAACICLDTTDVVPVACGNPPVITAG
jgi:2-phosphosulfolactate phosphatase